MSTGLDVVYVFGILNSKAAGVACLLGNSLPYGRYPQSGMIREGTRYPKGQIVLEYVLFTHFLVVQ